MSRSRKDGPEGGAHKFIKHFSKGDRPGTRDEMLATKSNKQVYHGIERAKAKTALRNVLRQEDES